MWNGHALEETEMSQLEFDQRVAEQLEVVYRSRDVRRRRGLVREALEPSPGDRILDVGCGPGYYVAELLEIVGAQGAVVGVDASADMLAIAERRCEGHDNAAFHRADATALPVADAAFDAAFSVQVLEYVEDATAALAEIHRALRPGGRAVIWDVDWATLSIHSPDPARTARVLDAWDKHLTHPSLPRTLKPRLRAAGFEDVRVEAHAFATTELDPESYGGFLVQFIEQFVVDQGRLDEAEASAWGDEQRQLDRDGEFFFACIQCCFTAVKPA
jgi:arsenite methyltransferase